MNNKSSSTRFLQTIGAYSCAVFLGAYLSSAYSHIAAKAVFVAILVLTLAIARSRARRTNAVIQFPAEAASASTHELAERHLDTYSRHFDLVSQAS